MGYQVLRIDAPKQDVHSELSRVQPSLGEIELIQMKIWISRSFSSCSSTASKSRRSCAEPSSPSANPRKLAVISPKRIRHHIGHNDWASRVHGGATRTVARSDRRPVHRFHIRLRQIRCGAVTDMLVLVAAASRFKQLLDEVPGMARAVLDTLEDRLAEN